MRISAPILAAALVGLLAAPAFAASPDGSSTQGGATQTSATSTTTPPKPQHTGPNPDDIICKYQQTVGTRIPTAKECHTRAQWQEMSDHSRDTMDNIQERGDTLIQRGGG